jgi:hypothetical protein
MHAPGMPNKLPDQPEVRNKQGQLVIDGKTWPYQRCLKSLRGHFAEELRRRQRG